MSSDLSYYLLFRQIYILVVRVFLIPIYFLRLIPLELQILREMNGPRIYFSDQNLNPNSSVEGSNTHYELLFKNFLHSFTKENLRIYQKRMQIQMRNHKYVLGVEVSDLRNYDEQLYEKLYVNPLEVLKIMEGAVKSYLKEHKDEFPANKDEEWQVLLRSDDNPLKIRDIKSNMVSRMFVISGIIISCTKPFIKASKLKLECKSCRNSKTIELAPGQYPYVPSFCEGQVGHTQKCPKDSFVALPTSEVIDAQHMKIQEFPEDVPVGEVARTYSLVLDRRNVSKCTPGDRVKITGVMLVNDMKTQQLSRGYMYVTGIQKTKQRSDTSYTQQEEEIFKQMSRDPRILEKIYSSIAPGIFGNEEIKKAIACMLFGGSRKHLPDETILRGDINVLLIGDPSTAKSQFLKFVQQAANIAVYTSGKGSSAAGLTASISKDSSTGEFQIEGGALVLADGGIVCIDEFDKMKQTDRVAIHEAMEQQTISVAKAGITTRLNSRTSVLAAANPILGRYDDLKEVQEQIELQSTILSRFDCIFIVRDINNSEANERIATHILDLHQGKIMKNSQTDVPFDIMKKYIRYARNRINPRLTPLASEKLQHIYVDDRQKAKERKNLNKRSQNIPITVRQLQAVIRLSEAIARMRLRNDVGIEEVEEAHYLFEVSTMKIIEGSREFGLNLSQGAAEQIQKAEELLKKKVCVSSQVSISKLMQEIDSTKFSVGTIERAINNMVKNGQFREIKGRKVLIRIQ